MTSGDMCAILPLPARPVNCGDKVYPVTRRRAVPRCLFGTPDPAETEKLYQEQTQRELERFQRRWNVDLELLEAAYSRKVEDRLSPAPGSNVEEKPATASSQALRPRPCPKALKRTRPTGCPKRQTYLTEFWRSRRSLAFVFGKSKLRALNLQTPALE